MTGNGSVCLAADIGGTFTDVVLDGPNGRSTRKILTTVDQPERGLLDGLGQLLADSGLSFSDVDLFVHGTTLATNAILERKGARTALLTTSGFRDVLEIATEGRFNQYDLNLVKPQPLVSRQMRLVIEERIDAAGNVHIPLDTGTLKAVAEMLRSHEIESLAICFLHSYMNPDHERQAAEVLSSMLPNLSISLSSDVCPEIGEYERTSTVVANAYVRPLIDGYLDRMEQSLAQAGFTGVVKLISSSGGITTISAARRFPIRLVESGPAGGAIFAAHRARLLGCDKVVAFDMGGTTAKVCLIRNGEPVTGNRFEVDRTERFMKGSGLPLRIPSVELVEIGAGGGSIAAVDALQRVKVGPESAGSSPGPACYPDGGNEPTVTDANLAIGVLDPEAFAGGRIRLNPDRANAVIDQAVGNELALSAEAAADSVIETVCESMASAIRVHAAELGEALAPYTMIAFGGAAPLHATRVAEKVGIGRVVIPANAGVGSAVGFLEAPHAFELVKSRHMKLETVTPETIQAIFKDIAHEAHILASADEIGADVTEQYTAFMRYVGQGHEIKVPISIHDAGACTAAALRGTFETMYEALFSRCIPDAEIEILSWSVLISGALREIEPLGPLPDGYAAEPSASRKLYSRALSHWSDTPVHNRTSLGAGSRIEGPAIIVEEETSTMVSASFCAIIDTASNIILQRKSGGSTAQ